MSQIYACVTGNPPPAKPERKRPTRNATTPSESPKNRYHATANAAVKRRVRLRPILSESEPNEIHPISIPREKSENAKPFASAAGSAENRESTEKTNAPEGSSPEAAFAAKSRTMGGSTGMRSPRPITSRNAVSTMTLKARSAECEWEGLDKESGVTVLVSAAFGNAGISGKPGDHESDSHSRKPEREREEAGNLVPPRMVGHEDFVVNALYDEKRKNGGGDKAEDDRESEA